MRRFIVSAAWIIVIGVIGYAFVLIGSPGYNRLLLEDEATVQDIEHIECVIKDYYLKEGKAPQNLDALKGYKSGNPGGGTNCTYCYQGILADTDLVQPSGKAYEYTPAADSYQLCAAFHTDWKALRQNRTRSIYWNGQNDIPHYDSGHFCFKLPLENCKKH